MKVLLRSPFSQLSGYGRDGIGLALALLERGHDVRISPDGVEVPLPRQIATLLTHSIEGPFDLAIHHVPPEKCVLLPSDAAMARQNVLWTMWGWSSVPDEDWVSSFAARTANFDQIVVYDADSAMAIGPLVPEDRLRIVLGGYTAADWGPERTTPGILGRPFTFGMNGRLTVRKGVYTAIEAFHLYRDQHPDERVALHLRTTEPILPPEYPLPFGLTVTLGRDLPPTLRTFYQDLDCLLCPSWAEAKHLPPIEALACGIPVVLSDIVGHRAWATSEMATYLPTKIEALAPGYSGGKVTAEDLYLAMLDQVRRAPWHRTRAQQSARTLPAMLDWTKCLERLGLAIGTRL